MSGALKGYRFLTALAGVVTSRHHSLAPARRFCATNQHQPLEVFRLAVPLPINVGEAQPARAVLVETEPAPRKGSYRY